MILYDKLGIGFWGVIGVIVLIFFLSVYGKSI
jgi:hypothetical protein